jgi:putative ABC transport system substrate-binding protein
VEVRSEGDFELAFTTFVERRAGALIVAASQLFDSNRDQLVVLAARHKLPAIYQAREFVLDGGLEHISLRLNRRDSQWFVNERVYPP